MLTINGRGGRLCDGMTRRDALKIGALGLGGPGGRRALTWFYPEAKPIQVGFSHTDQ